MKFSYFQFLFGALIGFGLSTLLYVLNADYTHKIISSVMQIDNTARDTRKPNQGNIVDPQTQPVITISEEGFGKGLLEMTPEERIALNKERVIAVHANRLGKDRINTHRKNQGLGPIEDNSTQEIETMSTPDGGGSATNLPSTTSLIASVPAQVDNSTLPAFPPIGNQGSLPSCVSWATTYYQMSHQVCLTLGCSNKASSNYIFSPRWTYNMVNGGLLQGTYFSDNYAMIQKHGAANIIELPYTSDYRSWSQNPDHWKKAINYRLGQLSYISMGTTTGIDQAKQILTNGHVLVVGTYISSAIYSTVRNATGESSPFAGQGIITHMNGTAGGHAMTIVGYDDSLWADINGNNIEDIGERGAFKVANSWGSGWKNGGFIWVAYDAFMTTSQVPGFAPAGRRAFAYNGTNSLYLLTYTQKSPTQLAKVEISHALRNQMSLQLGISSNTVKTPQQYFSPFALSYKGGGYAFDGTSIEKPGVFYFDLSDIAAGMTPSNSLYYLNAYDNISGAPLNILSFEIIDIFNNVTYSGSANIPSSIDQSNTIFIVGNYAGDSVAPTPPTNLAYTISTTTAKGKKGTTTTSLNLSWISSTDNVGVAKYAIYRNSVKLGESTSLKYTDSTTKTGMQYSYYVVALDAAGNQSSASNSLTVVR